MSETTANTGEPIRARSELRADAFAAARVLATVILIGAVCGIVVTGVLSRLAMALLAQMNPDATGVRSDDGFIMGQFTLSGSAQLAGAGLQLGVIGAFVYVAVRGLLIGPGWFRLLSISVGPGVVVGAMLVHTEGVDFHLLEPLWLAIGLFVLLPALFCAALYVLAERTLVGGGVRSKPLLLLGLLPAVVAFPLTVLWALGWLAGRQLLNQDEGSIQVLAWVARAGLAVVFLIAVADLVSDARALSG